MTKGKGATCPKCRKELSLQWDSEGEDNFWQCWDCDLSFTLDRDPAIYFTCVPDQGPSE